MTIEQQDVAALEVVAKQLSVRQTEALVRSLSNKPKQANKKPAKSSDVLRLEDELSERLGTVVTVEDKQGKGKLVIEYKSLDILDGILSHIK